jgi:hypothetical protein
LDFQSLGFFFGGLPTPAFFRLAGLNRLTFPPT